jgi:hypothetical protein
MAAGHSESNHHPRFSLPLIRLSVDVRFVPKADLVHRSKTPGRTLRLSAIYTSVDDPFGKAD